MDNTVVCLLLVGLTILLIYLYFKFFKIPVFGSLNLITGGVKCGKSTFAIYAAVKRYKSVHRKYKVICFVRKVLRFIPEPEEPLFYSNVPIAGIKYVEFSPELMLRCKRFAYRSVIYIQEASLVADSQMFRNGDVNTQLLFFNKLIGHETRGGSLFYDTQSLEDCHYAIKRSISTFFFIQKKRSVPFFLILYLRELVHCGDDKTISNVFNSDVDETMKRVIVPKSVFKRFDCYCYSQLTDHLPAETKTEFIPKVKFRDNPVVRKDKRKRLRTDKIVRIGK